MSAQNTRQWVRQWAIRLATVVMVAGAALGGVRPAQAGSPDFTVSVSPAGASVAAGGSTRYTLTVTSDNGFQGTVNVGIMGVSPQEENGPTFSLSRYDIWVSPSAPVGTARITAFTTTSTPATTYTVTVRGTDITGGPQHGITRETTFTLTVH